MTLIILVRMIMKIETIEIDLLKPAHYNPRLITKEELNKLTI